MDLGSGLRVWGLGFWGLSEVLQGSCCMRHRDVGFKLGVMGVRSRIWPRCMNREAKGEAVLTRNCTYNHKRLEPES